MANISRDELLHVARLARLDLPEEELQRLAKEMNFSETTFVYPPSGDGHVLMRIFEIVVPLQFHVLRRRIDLGVAAHERDGLRDHVDRFGAVDGDAVFGFDAQGSLHGGCATAAERLNDGADSFGARRVPRTDR